MNPNANIALDNIYLDKDNINEIILEYKPNTTINALDFTSNAPFLFDDCCISNNIPILHPFNLGWIGLIAVLKDKDLRSIQLESEAFLMKEPDGWK